jgi:PKD repeat protein/subtilisin family serine protease
MRVVNAVRRFSGYVVQSLVALLIVLGVGSGRAQDVDDGHWHSGLRGAAFDGREYGVVTFHDILTDQEIQALSERSVRVLEFIGGSEYLLSIPEGIDALPVAATSVRGVGMEEKMRGGWIDEIGDDDFVEVFVRYFADIPPGRVAELLRQQGLRVLNLVDLMPVARVMTTAEDILRLAVQPWVQYIETVPGNSKPDYVIPGLLAGANQLQSANRLPYTGRGVLVGLGDDGLIGPHIDLEGRVNHLKEVTAMPSNGIHGDLVAGLLAGAGNRRPAHQGLAPGAGLLVFDGMDVLLQAAQWHENQELALTCIALSDGCNEPYNLLASLADRQSFQYKSLLHIFSAGNAGQEDCGYGAGAGWGNITGGAKVSKNGVTVGNTDAEDQIVSNSSRGPAPDGRIKPDVCAPGTAVVSTLPDHEYGTLNGTSASAPVVAGITAQLIEAWRDWTNGETPPSALLKAILLNTAEDLGTPGPDFRYGFGRVNAAKAFADLKDEAYVSGMVGHDEQTQFTIEVPPGLDQLKILLYWHDREASPFAAKALVTDLDLKIMSPSGTTFLPLVPQHSPDPEQLAQASVPGRDSINNAEQIILPQPTAGTYTLTVQGTLVPLGAQPFVVSTSLQYNSLDLLYPDQGERLLHDTTIRIVWNASSGTAPFQLAFSSDDGKNWKHIAEIPALKRSYLWKVPGIDPAHILLRLVRGEEVSLSEYPSLVAPAPMGLQIDKKCPDQTSLSWNALSGASGYVVYQMGETQMDSVMTVSDTSASLPLQNPFQDHWFAVAAQFDSSQTSMRSEAICAPSGLLNCQASQDISLMAINSPSGGIIPDCFSAPLPLSFTFRNEGLMPAEGCCFVIRYDQQVVTTHCYAGIIPVGVPVHVSLDSILEFQGTGSHEITVSVLLPGDEVPQNDTLTRQITIVQGIERPLPWVEEFEGFPSCNFSEGCDQSCLLVGGWRNEQNGHADQTDWQSGPSSLPTDLTGGSIQGNAGFSNGNSCLFLENAGNCGNLSGHLLSPCINLEGIGQPVLEFWYLLAGQDAGSLYIDAFDGHEWKLNITAPLIGNQGNQWHKRVVSLGAFSDKTIMVRFRGTTGNSFLGQLTLDRIAVYDQQDLPVADFSIAVDQACPGAAIKFFDHSLNEPDIWSWQFEPPLVEYLNATNSHSPNPIVAFPETGTYNVTLKVSKSGGESTTVSRQIRITAGMVPPVRVNFETFFAPLPSSWHIINPDGQFGWERVQVLGKLGMPTHALMLNNHNYLKINEQDILRTSPIDLSDIEEPHLRFDLAYALYNNNFLDRLLVKVYPECGDGEPVVVFDQSGTDLTTVPEQVSGWMPTEPHHWAHRNIDLSAFVGQSVVLEFVNICGFGNKLFLDNLLIHEADEYPDIHLIWTPEYEAYCVGDTIIFDAEVNENAVFGPLFWTFGRHASPPFAFGDGPHKVVYNVPHTPRVRVRAMSFLGFDQAFGQLAVEQFPKAAFQWNGPGLDISFSNLSSSATSFHWWFGDGTQSTEFEPIHAYQSSGTFLVTLAATNSCGTDTTNLIIDGVTSLSASPGNPAGWTVYPNPASTYLTLSMPPGPGQELYFDILDLHGRVLNSHAFNTHQKSAHTVPLRALPPGSYIGRLRTSGAERHLIFVKHP